METALDGLRVVDLSESIAGQFCARLLADYGAEVLLLEPSAGSAIRRRGPFSGRDGTSLLFRHLNTGKRSLAVDVGSAEGGRVLSELAARADVVVAPPTTIDADALVRRSPGLVVCLVSDFGAGSVYERWTGSELIHQALSGVMFVTGEADRPPLYGLGQRASYAGGVTAYITILAALEARSATGRGQVVEATVAEAVAAMAPPDGAMQFAYSGRYARRGHYPNPIALLRCRDGWVVVFALRNWAALCHAFGAEDLVDDERFATPAARVQRSAEWRALIQERARRLDVDDVMHRAQRGKVSIGRVMTPSDLRACPHLEARSFWETVDAEGESRPVLGPVFQMSETPRRIRRGAPGLGADNAELGLPAGMGD